MRLVILAAFQMNCTWNLDVYIAKAEALLRDAAAQGAHMILFEKLFDKSCFCSTQN